MRPYMTEDEAKRRWCPMVRIHVAEGDSDGVTREFTNRPGKEGRHSCCIGSGCTWWGWEELPAGELSGTYGRCEAPGGAK